MTYEEKVAHLEQQGMRIASPEEVDGFLERNPLPKKQTAVSYFLDQTWDSFAGPQISLKRVLFFNHGGRIQRTKQTVRSHPIVWSDWYENNEKDVWGSDFVLATLPK